MCARPTRRSWPIGGAACGPGALGSARRRQPRGPLRRPTTCRGANGARECIHNTCRCNHGNWLGRRIEPAQQVEQLASLWRTCPGTPVRPRWYENRVCRIRCPRDRRAQPRTVRLGRHRHVSLRGQVGARPQRHDHPAGSRGVADSCSLWDRTPAQREDQANARRSVESRTHLGLRSPRPIPARRATNDPAMRDRARQQSFAPTRDSHLDRRNIETTCLRTPNGRLPHQRG